MTTRIDLDALARLAEKATPGEWDFDARSRYEEARVFVDGFERARLDGRKLLNEQADAEFIAACDPATVAALVRAAQALKEARPYVFNVACEHRRNWRGQQADDVLSRVIAALAPFAPETGEETSE